MSTLAYAQLTEVREQSEPGTSSSGSAPGVRTWVDALAALVPAEVLAVHAALVAAMTQAVERKAADGTTEKMTQIVDAHTLSEVFYALIVVSAVLYLFGRLKDKKWDKLDNIRILIPPLAFVGWTMLQRTTAFDAAWPDVSLTWRTSVAVIGAVVLGGASSLLASAADKKPPVK